MTTSVEPQVEAAKTALERVRERMRDRLPSPETMPISGKRFPWLSPEQRQQIELFLGEFVTMAGDCHLDDRARLIRDAKADLARWILYSMDKATEPK